MRTTAQRSTVLQAVDNVNKKHGYKIILNRDEIKGKYFHFTIKSEKSGISGSRTSHSGRKLISASWHAHGYLFDEIFKIDKKAVIHSLEMKIDISQGNWQDRNIGSNFHPMYFSETSIL